MCSVYKNSADWWLKQLDAISWSRFGLRFNRAVDGDYSGGVFAASTFAQ